MNSRRTRLRSALAVILTVLVLVPTGLLFGRVWSDASDSHDSTKLEQQGIEYLTALAPLTNALTESESAAIIGVAAPTGDLTSAISRLNGVDASLGATLSTTARWSTLKTEIDKVKNVKSDPTKPATLVTAYGAWTPVTDLALALYDAVRRNSGLNRDPQNDLSNLQMAVAIDTPQIVVHADRAGDLANMVQSFPNGSTKLIYSTALGEETININNLVAQLTADLQAAVNDTKSRTLSGSLVTTVDGFRRGVESMLRGANYGASPNIATVTTAETALQNGIEKLAGSLLDEMNSLLDSRLTDDSFRQTYAAVLGIITLVLILGAIAWPTLARRRQPEAPAAPAAPIGESTRDMANRSSGGYGSQYDQVPGYGEVNTTRRERSGALR